jgi:Uma2 family endonuclease
MATATIAMPAAASLALPDPDVLFEIINGEYREVPPMGRLASLIASVLNSMLWGFASQHKLGLPTVETLFRLSPTGPSRRPDVAFVAFDRMPASVATTEDPPQWEVVPNLAVEIVSPTNSVDDIESKLDDYFHAGVQLVWVVHPLRRRIYVYESLTAVRILLEKDELTGEPALPGFRLPVAALFAALVKPHQPIPGDG